MKKISLIVPCIKMSAMMLLAFVFLLPLSAHAQIKEGSFEVTPFAGYNFFETGQNLKDSPVFGGRLGYNFTNRFGIEVAGEYIRSKVDDRSITAVKEGRFTGSMDDVNLTFYHLDFLYHFMPEGKFNPFIVAGYGAAHYSPSISTKNMSAINYGIGAKYWMAENIAVRLDLRDNMVTEFFQETYHNINATVGIVFAFGGKAKSVPEPAVKSEPIAAEKVVVLVSEMPEPEVEKKVRIIASEPKIEEKIIILAFEDVHFDFEKATLNKEAKEILKKNVRILKNNPKTKVRIAGYTSASGSEEYNQILSEKRAKAVEEYLVQEGVVSQDRISTIGYGKTRPAEYEAAPKDLYSKAAKANMRVLFEIEMK